MISDLFIRGVRLEKDIPDESYLCDLPMVINLRKMEELKFHSKVTFLVGENCTFRINGAPFPHQRCKRLAPAVRYPFVAIC